MGFVRPVSEELVAAYERGDCSCGCDRWEITEAGFVELSTMNISMKPDARAPVERTQEEIEEHRRKFDELTDGDPDPADWWKP